MALAVDTLLTASGRRGSETLSLPALQSKMKSDPQSYESELRLLYNQFNSSLDLFHQQAAFTFNSNSGGGVGRDPAVAKELGERAMFLAHVCSCYKNLLAEFPGQLVELLMASGRALPSGLRCQVTQALVLLVNRKIVDIGETLTLFMELQTLGDKTLRKMAFLHVVHSIKRLNQKHKDQGKNRALQNVLSEMLKREEESISKRALVTLCDLHHRKVWFDDRTATAICMATLHPSSKILEATLQFLLDYEKIEDDDDSDASSSEDDAIPQKPQVVLSKEDVYKANHKGTTSSKKKKKAKLQRVMRSIKKQQRLTSQKNDSNYYYSPLNHLKDAQGFVEKLFSRLQTCNERFAVRMMMMKVIARTIGLHRLILLNFYPFLQRYVQPHQRDVTNLLAAAVQACHDMVPPDAVEPLFRQLVNQFVHDRSRSESIAVGLNVAREICLRIPQLMTEELLQDLVLYKKSHDKAVSSAARSLVTLFREICPAFLVKKDRGRPIDPKARPKAFGEVNVASDVAGIELLKEEDDVDADTDASGDDPTGDGNQSDYDNDIQANASSGSEGDDSDADEDVSDDSDAKIISESENDELEEGDEGLVNEDAKSSADEVDSVSEVSCSDGMNDEVESHHDAGDGISKGRKRKLSDFDIQLNAADSSLRALKKIATRISNVTPDGILSDEDFQRIKEEMAKKEAKATLSRHGLLKKGSDSKSASSKIPSSEQLSMKRVDPAKLEARTHRKLTKEQRMELVRAGREEGGKYQARTALKQKKKGGLSNKQKEHKKAMPLAAKRAKVKRSGQEKKRKQARSKKQFRGKKAWK